MSNGMSWAAASAAGHPVAGGLIGVGVAIFTGTALYYRVRGSRDDNYASQNRAWRHELRYRDTLREAASHQPTQPSAASPALQHTEEVNNLLRTRE